MIANNKAINFFLLSASILFAILFIEVLLRIIPSRYTGVGPYNEPLRDPILGYRLSPNRKSLTFNRKCVSNDRIRTNSLGFRDDEWSIEKKAFRIAVLGDSYMEALQIRDGKLLSDLLENRLGSGYEVMNFGISGYGTLHQYLAYHYFARQYKPDLVLLFFCSNDIVDNSLELMRMTGRTTGIIAQGYVRNGECMIKMPSYNEKEIHSTNQKIKRFLKKHCRTLVAAKQQLNRLKVRRKKTSDKLPVGWKIYMPYKDKEWIEAWQLTEHFLVELLKDVKEDNANLVVFTIPNFERLCKNWREEVKDYIGGTIPSGFDPYRPNRKINEIARSSGIKFVMLEPYFLDYMDKHNTNESLFFFKCDGHFTEIGHQIATDAVYEAIKEHLTFER